MYTLACRDFGVDCDFVAKADSQDACMSMSMEHAMKEHAADVAKMKETMSDDQIKADMMAKMKQA